MATRRGSRADLRTSPAVLHRSRQREQHRPAHHRHRPRRVADFPTGERAQFVIPPACEAGNVSITIRLPSKQTKTLAQYQQDGFFDEIVEVGQGIGDADRELLELRAGRHYADFFRKAVLNKKNIVVSGATGSGKTTFMKSLVHHIPDNERLVTIEDARELFIAQP